MGTLGATAGTALLAISTGLSVGCGNAPRSSQVPTGPSAAAVPAPTPPSPQPSGHVVRLGEPISGTISSESHCKFAIGNFRSADLCDAFTLVPPEDGTLVVDVRVGADAALALRFRTETAEIIDALCCTPITGRIPVRADLAVQIELAYVGRPAGYPSIQAVPYTLELSLLTGDLQQERGRVQAIVFGDATRTQRLSHARIEVLDGPSVGHVARFDQVTGLYELHDFAPGFVRVRTSAAGFNPVEQELAVATQRPREIVLPRTVTPADSTHELTGMASSFQINVKIEIIDGPLAGVFTLTDEDMGVFVLRSLPPGPMQVRASRGQRSETLTVNISGPSTHVVFHHLQ